MATVTELLRVYLFLMIPNCFLCQQQENNSSNNNVDSTLGLGIMPGTNWCGRGFQANGYRDLGSYGGADKCCRQHDLGCPAWIPSGQTRYGLYNYKYYTMNHCTCDERFRSCLRMVNSARADLVGQFYFNIIRIPCFTLERINHCSTWTWWGKCIDEETSRQAVLRQPLPYY
eukprot:13474.XXX_1043637_1045168_1 [CDS] Oithona nana genome sequencing.